jgi:hypothetical protein
MDGDVYQLLEKIATILLQTQLEARALRGSPKVAAGAEILLPF